MIPSRVVQGKAAIDSRSGVSHVEGTFVLTIHEFVIVRTVVSEPSGRDYEGQWIPNERFLRIRSTDLEVEDEHRD